MTNEDTLRAQLKVKSQELEAWRRSFMDPKSDATAKMKASQNYMICQRDLKELREVLDALDVDNEVIDVRKDIVQEISANKKTLVNESVKNPMAEEKLVADFEFFCAHLEITYRPGLNPDYPEGGYGPFILADGQKKVADLMINIMLIERRPLRVIILKSRQLGCTTLLLAFWIWLLTRYKHFHVFFMIDVGTHAVTKRTMVIRWIDSLNKRWPHLFAGVKRGQKKEKILGLSNNSILFIDSAESTNPGTSEMLHVLHTSEKPKWPRGRARSIKESVEPALPSSAMTANVDESTACGLDDFYYKWKLAVTDKDAGIIPIFLPWFITSECQLKVKQDFSWSNRVEFRDHDPDTDKEISEIEYSIKYDLSKEQIVWRRWAILTKFEGNRNSFDQEHPTTPSHAFRQFANQFFGKGTRINVAKSDHDCFRGSLVDSNGNNNPNRMANWAEVSPEFEANDRGPLFIRDLPKAEERYYIGADVAEGKSVVNIQGKQESDYTVFSVKDSKGRSVAIWVARIPPEEAWLPLLLLAVFYNKALVNGERNNHGYTLLVFFWRTFYPKNLIESEPKSRTPKERAWTLLSRSELRMDMLKQLRSLYTRIPDSLFSPTGHEESLQKQIENFVKSQTPGGSIRYEAAKGFHDDIIFAEAHAYRAVAFGEGMSVYTITGDCVVERKADKPQEEEDDSPRLSDTDIASLIGGAPGGTNGYSLTNYGGF